MLKVRSQFAGLMLVAGLLLAAGEFGVSVAGAGPARAAAGPGDLLSDAYDALSEDRPDLARKIFQTLLNAYPQSTEAARAADELASLESAGFGEADAPASGEANASTESYAGEPGQGEPQRTLRIPASSEGLRRVRQRFLIDVGDRVFFAENSDALGGRARATLEAQARWLKAATNLDVTIIGRAADGGSASDNRALSLARAQAVQAKLIEGGVAPERIKVEARGNTDPVATCTQPLCEAHNRHVESLVRYPGMETSQAPATTGRVMFRDASRSPETRGN